MVVFPKAIADALDLEDMHINHMNTPVGEYVVSFYMVRNRMFDRNNIGYLVTSSYDDSYLYYEKGEFGEAIIMYELKTEEVSESTKLVS
ncbi:hypothetical protein JEZ13_04220 [bacterium]|nr:hypothetical protein [bacterium]MBI9072935.1 hypothetical protein [Melioribacteraceae bacterium]